MKAKLRVLDSQLLEYDLPSTSMHRPLIPALGDLVFIKGQTYVVTSIVWNYDENLVIIYARSH